MISLFFLAIMAPGFCLDKIVDELKERTKAYSLLSMAVGLALIWIAPIEWLIIPDVSWSVWDMALFSLCFMIKRHIRHCLKRRQWHWLL